MSKQIQRYQKILSCIPCYPESITSLELVALLLDDELLNFNSSAKSQMRTVQRTLCQILEECLSVEVITACRPHQYQISQGHPHPINPDSMSSVVSLQVIKQEVSNMLPPTLRNGIQTIFNSLTKDNNKKVTLWRQRFCYFPSGFQLESPIIEEDFFKQIEKALLLKKDVCILYQKRGAAEPIEYTVTPLGVVLYGKGFYLISAKSCQPNEYRTFALHRIHSLRLHFSTLKPLVNFDIRQHVLTHIPHFSGGEIISVKLRIDNYSGLHLIEESLVSKSQTVIAKDESTTTISAEVRWSLSFEWWLMKHAYIVEVLEPIELRNNIVELIKKAATLYDL